MKSQLEISFDFTGAQLRDVGIQLATDRAESIHPNWREATYNLFKEFLREQDEPFLIEDFRSWIALNHPDYEWPGSLRAFGFVSVRGAIDKLIKQIGTRKVKNKNAHCANSALWVRI